MSPIENWPNGFVYHTQNDIRIREYFIDSISNKLFSAFKTLNKSIDFVRIEMPCLKINSLLILGSNKSVEARKK